MRLHLCLFGILLIPSLALGVNKDIAELQREIGQLQDQVRTLQSRTDEKLAAMTVLLQQTLDAANKGNNATATLDSRVNERLEKSVVSVGQPVAVLGTKVDQMANDFAAMKDSMNDVVSRIGKLDQRLVELNNTVKTVQSPPPAPGPAGFGGPAGGAAAAPSIPPDTLYESAYRDKMGGKPDLALKEFNDYVQLYGDTDKAPSAQFWIGQIFLEQRDFPNAVKAFDQVLERYGPAATKAPEAMLKKGQALVLMDKRNDGAQEFRGVLSKYPHSDVAPKACSELKALGLSCNVSVQPARKKARARG